MTGIQQLLLEQARGRLPHASEIVEIGCGSGMFTAHVARAFPHAALTGADISAKAIRRAEKRQGALAQWHVAPAESMPFKDESFDLIFACLTFHHWSDKQQGLREVARILKPEGLFLLGDPFSEGLLQRRSLNWVAQKLDGGKFTHLEDLEHMLTCADMQLISKTVVSSSVKMLSVCAITRT